MHIPATPRLRHLAPLIVSFTLAVACDDPATQAPAPTDAPDNTTANFHVALIADSSWDHYSADVTVTLEERPGFGYNGPSDYRAISYHVERTRGYDNIWSSVVQYAPYTPLGVPSAPNVTQDLSRLEAHDAGDYSRFYNRYGALVSSPAPVATQVGLAPSDTLDRDWPSSPPPPPPDDPPPEDDPLELMSGVPSLRVMPVLGAAPQAVRLSKREGKISREQANEWLDEIVLTPSRRDKRLEKLERRLGKAEPAERGLRRHVTRDRGLVREVLVDTAVGAVLELNVAREGKLLHRTMYGYTALGGGIFVRTRTRIERPRADRPDQPLAIDHVLSNVRVERRGAQ
jgi:hypothetical protein